MEYVVIVENFRLSRSLEQHHPGYKQHRVSKTVLPAFDKNDAYKLARSIEHDEGLNVRRETHIAVRFNSRDGSQIIPMEILDDIIEQYTAPPSAHNDYEDREAAE